MSKIRLWDKNEKRQMKSQKRREPWEDFVNRHGGNTHEKDDVSG
jgi:hypothetical protein